MTISAFRTQCASYSTHPGIARWEFSNAQIYSIIHNSLFQIELQMMYACTKSALQREVDLTRVYEIRELDELTEEWLKAKLK